MLYRTTRNNLNTYTAHRALHEEYAPDGGYFVPFYVPVFSSEALSYLKKNTVNNAVAEILNLFFSLRLSASDVDDAINGTTISSQNLNQNLTVVELWHTPDGTVEFIYKRLNQLITGNLQLPVGWTKIAIEIALLFAAWSTLSERYFDMAVSADNLSVLTAIPFAKTMGLPVNLVVCACDDNNSFWDLVNKGECNTSRVPEYIELLLHKVCGGQSAVDFVETNDKKRTFHIDEDVQQLLSNNFYPAVVSSDRSDSIISGMFRSNNYLFDYAAARAYGSLQDYRAIVGSKNQTVILAQKRPECIKE